MVELSTRYYREQQSVVRRAADTAQRAWRDLDPGNLTGSWDAGIGQRITATVTEAQTSAAALAQPYVTATTAQAETQPGPVGELVASAFAGLAADGRPLLTLLRLAVRWALWQMRLGIPVSQAHAAGLDRLLLYVTTEVADAGRIATQVAMAAEPGIAGYERVVVLPACGRCLILAGRVYLYTAEFLRHPRCDCQMRPVTHTRQDADTSPRALFDAMSPAQQDKALGMAGADAVRAGADLSQIVNARRGMYAAGDRQLTREGTTRRGLAGQRTPGPRPMPSELLRTARDRDELTSLLHSYGYLI